MLRMRLEESVEERLEESVEERLEESVVRWRYGWARAKGKV